MNASMIRNEKGVVLLFALMVLIMLGLMGLVAMLTGTTDIQIAANSAHSTQALYLAESGVGRVKSWFESPGSFNPPSGSYTLDPQNSMAPYADTDMQSFFRKRRADGTGAPSFISSVSNLSQFTDINNSGGPADLNDANNENDDGHTTDQNGARNDGDHPVLSITNATAAGKAYLNSLFQDLSSMGQVTTLEIYPPMLNTNFATVRVTAVDAAGATRTIEQEIGPSNNFTVANGLSANGAAGWNGNGSVNWGAIVTATNVSMGINSLRANHSGVTYGGQNITYDKWWSLDSGGTVTVTGPGITFPDYANYNVTPNSTTKQPQTLSSDQKAALKQYSQDTGQYYVYCSTDGLLHTGDKDGNPTGAGISFRGLTNGKSYEMLYVDIGASTASCNPTDPGMPVFDTSGGYFTRSNMILNGTFSIAGSGPPTHITDSQNPDQVAVGSGYTPLDVHIEGFIYTTGNFDSSGNPVVYGAVIAEGGFTGSGTPDIWYNANLKNGLPVLPITSVQGWREIRK